MWFIGLVVLVLIIIALFGDPKKKARRICAATLVCLVVVGATIFTIAYFLEIRTEEAHKQAEKYAELAIPDIMVRWGCVPIERREQYAIDLIGRFSPESKKLIEDERRRKDELKKKEASGELTVTERDDLHSLSFPANVVEKKNCTHEDKKIGNCYVLYEPLNIKIDLISDGWTFDDIQRRFEVMGEYDWGDLESVLRSEFLSMESTERNLALKRMEVSEQRRDDFKEQAKAEIGKFNASRVPDNFRRKIMEDDLAKQLMCASPFFAN